MKHWIWILIQVVAAFLLGWKILRDLKHTVDRYDEENENAPDEATSGTLDDSHGSRE